MRHHTGSKAKAGWLIISGQDWAGPCIRGSVAMGIALLVRRAIGIKLPGFILIGSGLILVLYGSYGISRRVKRWHQDHYRPPAISKNLSRKLFSPAIASS